VLSQRRCRECGMRSSRGHHHARPRTAQ
jgi:hypothetical protein